MQRMQQPWVGAVDYSSGSETEADGGEDDSEEVGAQLSLSLTYVLHPDVVEIRKAVGVQTPDVSLNRHNRGITEEAHLRTQLRDW